MAPIANDPVSLGEDNCAGKPMSGIIIFPYTDPWIVSSRAWDILLQELIARLERPDDLETIRVAAAIRGIHFDKMPRKQVIRISPILAEVADDLRLRLRAAPHEDEPSHSFAELLGRLEMSLRDLYE